MDDLERIPPLEELFTADVRYRGGNVDAQLAGLHEEVSSLELSATVPPKVKQSFETAKMVVLSTWHWYRFHQVAEIWLYAVTDLALRVRIHSAGIEDKPSYRWRINEAMRQGWLSDSGFRVWRRRQAIAAHQKAFLAAMKEGANRNLHEFELPEVEEFDGEIGDPDYRYLDSIIESHIDRRNEVMHGSSSLANTAVMSLRFTYDVIEQLYGTQGQK